MLLRQSRLHKSDRGLDHADLSSSPLNVVHPAPHPIPCFVGRSAAIRRSFAALHPLDAGAQLGVDDRAVTDTTGGKVGLGLVKSVNPLLRRLPLGVDLVCHTAAYSFSIVHCSGCWFCRAKSITWVTFVSATS